MTWNKDVITESMRMKINQMTIVLRPVMVSTMGQRRTRVGDCRPGLAWLVDEGTEALFFNY